MFMQVCLVEKFLERIDTPGKLSTRSASIELTRYCNLRCGHCFSVRASASLSQKSELGLDDWERILGECCQEGVLYLTVSGGEPLLHPHFRQVWKIAKRMGFLVTLFSNGTLITEEIADFLAEWTPLEVSITLYGASDKTYEEVTGSPGMFERVTSAFEHLRNRKINLEIKGVLSKANVKDFADMKKIALQYCDAFRWDAELMGAFEGCRNTPQQKRISLEEYIALEVEDKARFQELRGRFGNDWSPKLPESGPFRCGVGKGSFHIDAFGGLHPCLPLESMCYDLLNGSLADGWHRAIPEMLREVAWDRGPCNTCDAAELCNCCAAFALLEKCPPTGPVPYRCNVALQRVRVLGLSDRLQSFLHS